jgi:BlaI family transcriptional regulator, penicillinase repressor
LTIKLTGLQLAVMRVLWARGEASVLDVQEALREDDRDLAQTTVATLLARLEKRGVAAYRLDGRQYVYRPLISEARVRESVLADVTHGLFGGDVTTLVSHLLSTNEVAEADLARVRALIDSRARKLKERT